MRPTFEPYELNEMLGVPRDEEPEDYFNREKFMDEDNKEGRRQLSWFSPVSSAMETAVKSLHEMFKNAFMSRFAAPDENVCQPVADSNACNAIDSCSWCSGKNVTDACRPLWSAKDLPETAFNCSKVTAEDKEAAHKKLLNEFAGIMSMEVYGDEQQCNKTTDMDICHHNTKCAWCKPSDLIIRMGSKANHKSNSKATCHARDNLKQVPAAFVDCDLMYEDEHIWMTTFMYNIGKKLAGFGVTPEESTARLLTQVDSEDQEEHPRRHHKRHGKKNGHGKRRHARSARLR
jgi:hypothetical protein